MAEQYSQAGLQLGRFDKSAAVPTGQATADMSEANKWKGIADAIGMFADKGGEAYAAKINKERRDEAKKRSDEAYARQEKNRKENEARIEAERIYTETGGGKSWEELSEEEKTHFIQTPDTDEIKNKGTKQLPSKTKPSILTKEQSQDEFLKNAYQQKRTEGVLKKQQSDWDAVAPNLVDKVYDEWKLQRNNDDGEPDFTKYASAKLEVYKLERAQEHFIGLPQLGEALKNVPINDDKYLSMVAKRKQEYVDELKDKNIQSGIDTHLNGDPPLTDLGNPDKIDALVEHISTLGPEGTKEKGPDGKVLRIHDRDTVQFQIMDDIESKLTNATSSDDPVFKIIDSFTGENEKKGRMMMERRGKVGEGWEKVLDKAMKKKLALKDKEEKASGTLQKIKKENAKVESGNILMNVSEALDYQVLGVGTHTAGTGPAPTLKEDGTLEGKPTKVMALANAYSNLLANKQAFADAGMSKEYLAIKDKLTTALNKEDPTNSAFDAPNSELAKNAESNFRANISELNEEQLEKLRVEVNNETQNQPWLTTMKHKVIDDIYKDLGEKRDREKEQLAIQTSKQTLEKNKKEKSSGELKRNTLASFRNNKGEVLSLKELNEKRQEIESGKGLTDDDSISLLSSIDTLIDRQIKSEGFKKDSEKHATIFKDITTLGPDGKLKSATELETLRNNVLNHTWTNEAQKNSLLTLIASASGKSGDYKRELKKQNDQITHKKHIRKLTAKTDKDIQDLIMKVSLPKGHEERISFDDAKKQLKDMEDSFFDPNGNISKEIAKGELLGVDGKHDERFKNARASILGQRTEEEIAQDKTNLEDLAELSGYERDNKTSEIRLQIADMMDDPTGVVMAAPGASMESNLDKVIDLVNTTEEKINENGTLFENVPLFSPTEKQKIIDDFKIKVKERKAPATISENTSKVQAFTNIQEIKTLTGSKRQEAITLAENYLKKEYLNNRLSTSDFNTEKSILHQIAKDGKVKTKPAYQTGEDHIRSLFAGHASKYLSNADFLPKNEDGKLYNELSKAFNRAWSAKSKELHGADEATQMAEAIKLAETFTKVYPNPANHPIDPDINRRLMEYQMPTEELMELYYEREDALELQKEQLESGKENDNKKQKPKLKSQFRQELSRDTRVRNFGRPISILGAIIEEISTIGTDTEVDWIPVHSHARQPG